MAKKTNIVKSTKSNIVLCVIALIAIGWLLVMVGLSENKDQEAQDALVKEAEGFLEDKLYIRAVNNYKKALQYKTDNNDYIEQLLVDAYGKGEMLEEYYDLIQKRIEKGTASVDEIMDLGEMYASEGNYLGLVRNFYKAVKIHPDNKEIISLYEQYRFLCNRNDTNFEVVKNISEGYIPAFDGEKWGFLGPNGRKQLDFKYDEATCFSDDFAVVKEDGKYVLISAAGYWYAVDKDGLTEVKSLNGAFMAASKNGKYGIYSQSFERLINDEFDDVILSDNGMVFVKQGEKWALLSDKLEKVTDYIFSDVVVNQEGSAFSAGFAVVADNGGYYLIQENGKQCFDKRYPNAKGMENGWVAVSDSSGKWGFIDETGELKIECRYEDAFSFSNKLAPVCKDGKWGYIDNYDTMVIENQYTMAWPFTDGYAIVKDEQGLVAVLKFMFYDYIK